MSVKYPSLDNHSLSISCSFRWNWCSMFIPETTVQLQCAAEVLCMYYLDFLMQNIRHVLKSQDLIKVIIFMGLSRTFSSKTSLPSFPPSLPPFLPSFLLLPFFLPSLLPSFFSPPSSPSLLCLPLPLSLPLPSPLSLFPLALFLSLCWCSVLKNAMITLTNHCSCNARSGHHHIAPSGQTWKQWKMQLMSQYYYKSSFDLLIT